MFDGSGNPTGQSRLGHRAEYKCAVLGVDRQWRGLRGLVSDQRHGQVGIVAQVGSRLERCRGHGEQTVGSERLEVQATARGADGRQRQPDDAVHQGERLAGHL